MAFAASEIITRARDVAPEHTLQSTPDAVALRALEGMARRLRAETRKFDPQQLSTDVTISLPLATFANGHTFSTRPEEILHGLCVYDDGEVTEFDLISVRSREQVRPRWSGWLEDDTLFLAGKESHWSGFSSIVLKVIEPQADLTAMSTSIVLEDTAIDPLAAELALFMARRVRPKMPVSELERAFSNALDRYLDGLATRQRANVTVTREVW